MKDTFIGQSTSAYKVRPTPGILRGFSKKNILKAQAKSARGREEEIPQTPRSFGYGCKKRAGKREKSHDDMRGKKGVQRDQSPGERWINS